MLIESRRHRADDLDAWAVYVEQDRALAKLRVHKRRVEKAKEILGSFAALHPECYVATSWGKDSVVVASLAQEVAPHLPLVWVRVEPISNPDCAAVRDAFLERYPSARYDEIESWCTQSSDGEWHATGTLERGFKEAAALHGDCYISGIRAAESGARKLRHMRWGHATERTCAPISDWPTPDVFAYLTSRGLPVHPAYACTMGGLYDRDRIRVASLGGKRGQGHGREEWENTYYPEGRRFQ